MPSPAVYGKTDEDTWEAALPVPDMYNKKYIN